MGTRSTVAATQEGPQAADCLGRFEARSSLSGERHGRSNRLGNGSLIRWIARNGQRAKFRTLEVRWVAGATPHARLALIVPRWGGSAVARNRLRRRLREIWRRQVAPGLPALDMVVRATPRSHQASFAELSEELASWRRKIP